MEGKIVMMSDPEWCAFRGPEGEVFKVMCYLIARGSAFHYDPWPDGEADVEFKVECLSAVRRDMGVRG